MTLSRILSFCRSLLAGDSSHDLAAGVSNRRQAGSDSRFAKDRRVGGNALHLSVLALGLALLAGCTTPDHPAGYPPLVARFYLEVRPGETGVPAQLPVSGVNITVSAKPVLVEYDIYNAEVAHVDLGTCLMLQLTPAAARDLYRLSVSNLGRRLVLFLNDAPLGARRIEQAMPDGTLLVFVEVPDAELAPMVARLKRTSAEIITAAAKKK